MRRRPTFRPKVWPAVLAAVIGLAACSSGGSGGDSSDATGVSETAYCEAVKALYDLGQSAQGGSVPPDQQDEFVAELAKAAAAAPPAIRDDFNKAFNGDAYASDNVNQYNKSKCGLDTSLTRPQ